jgi:SAM-dependent methyltransferase
MSDYIFKSSLDGRLEFVGDFDGMYSNEADPWGQSSESGSIEMREYYKFSRKMLVENILRWSPVSKSDKLTLVEFGSGTGYVLREISKSFPNYKLIGVDISQVAISRAIDIQANCSIDFYVGSVTEVNWSFKKNVDIVVISNLLWYVLNDLESMFHIALSYLRPGGVLIIQNAFFKQEQLYGREVIDGYQGFVSYFLKLIAMETSIAKYEFRLFSDTKMHHSDGAMILQLKD